METTETGKEKDGATLLNSIEEFISEELGASAAFFAELQNDTDWSFVIKCQALLETALNHAIVTSLKEPRLAAIVAVSDLMDKQRGKLAFIKALDILPDEMQKFIEGFAPIRNAFVHNAKNLKFRISDWVDMMNQNQRDTFRKRMRGVLRDRIKVAGKMVNSDILVTSHPRMSIMVCVLSIVGTIYAKHPRCGMKHGEAWQIQAGSRTETPRPNSKELK